jgi:exonuclease VII large subunit
MAYFTLADDTACIEDGIVFSPTYARIGGILSEGRTVLVEGELGMSGGGLNLKNAWTI